MSRAAAVSNRSTMPRDTAQQATIRILPEPLTNAYGLQHVTAILIILSTASRPTEITVSNRSESETSVPEREADQRDRCYCEVSAIC